MPYRLLNNYYTNQVPTAQVLVESWRTIGVNVEIEMKENFPQVLSKGPTRAVRDWSNRQCRRPDFRSHFRLDFAATARMHGEADGPDLLTP